MNTLSRLMSAARESLEGGGALPIEEQAEALQDTGLTSEIIEEVQAPAAELDQGLNDVAAADAEADGLDNTAEILNDSVADGGQGVDPAAAELAANQIQAAAERFSLAHACARPARESFATSAGRRDATLSLAREAEFTSKSLRERVSAAIKQAIEWLKNLLASVLDKSVRLEKRAKAVAAKAKGAEAADGGKAVKMNIGFLGTEGAVEVARKLGSAATSLSALETASSAKELTAVDLNPEAIGSVELKLDVVDGKYKLVKIAPEGSPKEGVSLSTNAAMQVAESVAKAAGQIRNAKKSFDKVNSDLNGLLGAIKNANGDEAGRSAAFSKARAIPSAAGALVGLLLNTGARLLDLADKSLSANAAKAA